MSHDFDQRLVYMANQIGKFFAFKPADQAVAGIENHLRKFWEPRMRQRIIAYLERGDGGLEAYPKQAVINLRDNINDEARGGGSAQANPALSGAKLATGEDRGDGSTEAEPMIPDSVLRAK